MSKVVKGVKKVFKKVVKVVKKVVPIVLAAAAIYFTAGAALGITSATGGWTAAASKIGAAFGQGALGSTITGAITSAGYGAAFGGATSAALGGSFTEGAKGGAAIGAITGGIGGYMNRPIGTAKTTPLPDSPGYGAPMIEGQEIPSGLPREEIVASSTVGPAPGASIPSTTEAALSGPPVARAGSAAVNTPGGLDQVPQGSDSFLGKGGWLERNQKLAGGAIAGVGQGLMANASVEGDMAFLQKRRDLISANYAGTDPGANYRKLAGRDDRKDRYDPRTYGSWEYQYDPAQGRIIKVPIGG